MAEYSKEETEAIFRQNGIDKVQEDDGIAIYDRKIDIGSDDIVIDWSEGNCDWSDIARQLEDAGVPKHTITGIRQEIDNRRK